MTEQKETKQPVKYCVDCKKVKTLAGGFYKAGKSYQKRCILCHNAKRCEYSFNKNYIKKPTGYMKLDEDLRKKIEYDIYVRINFKDIYTKYQAYGIKYQTLLMWNRKGQIKTYEEP
jgi:hypothetical protein